MDLKACCIIQVFITGKKQNFSICFLKYFFHSFMQRNKDFNSSMASLELIKNISHISDQLYMASNTFLLGVCLLMAPINVQKRLRSSCVSTRQEVTAIRDPWDTFPFIPGLLWQPWPLSATLAADVKHENLRPPTHTSFSCPLAIFLWKFLLRLFIILLLCSFYSVINFK